MVPAVSCRLPQRSHAHADSPFHPLLPPHTDMEEDAAQKFTEEHGGKVQCPMCGKSFETVTKLTVHVVSSCCYPFSSCSRRQLLLPVTSSSVPSSLLHEKLHDKLPYIRTLSPSADAHPAACHHGVDTAVSACDHATVIAGRRVLACRAAPFRPQTEPETVR